MAKEFEIGERVEFQTESPAGWAVRKGTVRQLETHADGSEWVRVDGSWWNTSVLAASAKRGKEEGR